MNAPSIDRATEYFRSTLTPEQNARWDDAMRAYDATYRGNISRWEGSELSDEEWASWKTSPRRFMNGYQPGHHSSALFRRLLEGGAPLAYPPPLSYSYPWYEAIESAKPLTNLCVAFEGERASAMTLAEHARKRPGVEGAIGIVQIQQHLWTLLSRDGDCAIVTYGEWAAAGYRWRLTFRERDVDEVECAILCHHDPKKGHVRTGDELWEEAKYHVHRRLAEDRAVVEGKPLPESEFPKGVTPGKVALPDAYLRDVIKARLDQRTARGLSALPTESTIRKRVKTMFQQYLHFKGEPRPSWRIDETGRLKALRWELERVSPDPSPASN